MKTLLCAPRDHMVVSLLTIGTWPARDYASRITALWPANIGAGKKTTHLCLNNDDPLLEPLAAKLIALKLESL